MMEARETYRIYKELAEREGERHADQLRDRFLVLAADAALTAGKEEEAEHLSDLLLTVNPTHLLKPFPSFKEAMQSAEVAGYVADLRRTYPPEEAERLLQSLHGPTPVERPLDKPVPVPMRLETEKLETTYPLSSPLSSALPESAPAQVPPVYRPEPAAPVTSDADAPVPSRVSYFVATGLFVIALAATLALAGHVFVRPFIVM